ALRRYTAAMMIQIGMLSEHFDFLMTKAHHSKQIPVSKREANGESGCPPSPSERNAPRWMKDLACLVNGVFLFAGERKEIRVCEKLVRQAHYPSPLIVLRQARGNRRPTTKTSAGP